MEPVSYTHLTADELLSGAGGNNATKTEQAERLILDLLFQPAIVGAQHFFLFLELCILRLQRGDIGELAAYAGQHPDQCRQTDADPDTGCMEFEIRKGRFSFRLTAPYSAERRRAASEAAKKCGVHRKITHLYGDSN